MTFASAQEQQPTTAAIEPTPPGREDAIPSTASVTNRDPDEIMSGLHRIAVRS